MWLKKKTTKACGPPRLKTYHTLMTSYHLTKAKTCGLQGKQRETNNVATIMQSYWNPYNCNATT